VLPNWHANQFGQKGFRKLADLWMVWGHHRKWTTIAMNRGDTFTLFKLCQATKLIEGFDCLTQTRLSIPISTWKMPPGRQSPTDGAQQYFPLLSSHAFTESI
jgi:hypothetical protein